MVMAMAKNMSMGMSKGMAMDMDMDLDGMGVLNPSLQPRLNDTTQQRTTEGENG